MFFCDYPKCAVFLHTACLSCGKNRSISLKYLDYDYRHLTPLLKNIKRWSKNSCLICRCKGLIVNQCPVCLTRLTLKTARPKKESSLPTIIFQGPCQILGCVLRWCLYPWCYHLHQNEAPSWWRSWRSCNLPAWHGEKTRQVELFLYQGSLCSTFIHNKSSDV